VITSVARQLATNADYAVSKMGYILFYLPTEVEICWPNVNPFEEWSQILRFASGENILKDKIYGISFTLISLSADQQRNA
jgi:hypothetical protein